MLDQKVKFSSDVDCPTHSFKKGQEIRLKLPKPAWQQIENAAGEALTVVKVYDGKETDEPKKRGRPKKETAAANPSAKGAENATE